MSRKDRFIFGFVALRLLCDITMLYVVFNISYYVRFHLGLFLVDLGVPLISYYQPVFLFGTVLIVVLFRNQGLYKGFWRGTIAEDFFKIIKSVLLGIFIMMAFSFLYREFSYSRGMALVALPLLVSGIFIERMIVDWIEHGVRLSKGIYTKVLIIGSGEDAAKLVRAFTKRRTLGYNIKGFISDEKNNIVFDGIQYPVLGSFDSLDSVFKDGDIDEAILAEKGFTHDRIISAIITCEKNLVTCKLVPDILEMMTSNVDITHVDGVSLLNIHRFPLQSLWSRCVKRSFDFVISLLFLIIFSPIMFLVACVLKIDSKGPVLYKQERCGEDGRLFNILKFRTMIVNAENETGPVWAKKDDQRRTRLGRVLRETNMDELPQLINVVRGDMSLVGPRPERPHFVNQFKENVPRYMSRHLIKSGITGWAQVNGFRGDTSIEERIKYDLFYIENWSLFFDIKILFFTIFARKNAY
ncbi:MAG: undecaprenyl-phosphate glucose phosphotransferase [Candidatus Ancaeobacter aquaticus]|nr:undecaprenyl-phosphate glucose phosphotransferase [Candidatus Ancaeobacter aquaticus]